MAITSAAVAKPTGTRPRKSTAVFAVTATADGDTGNLTIAHGLAVIPDAVYLTPITAAGVLSGWAEVPASRTTANVVVTKTTTAAGSGAAPAQLYVYIEKPHTITR